MSSALNVWNLALSHLGDKAGLSSVVAPYASREAQLCAQFWDIARTTALQKSKPSFARKRIALAPLDLGAAQPAQWAFAYAIPSDSIQFLGVYSPDRFYDESDEGSAKETDSTGNAIVFTNVEEAIGKYIYDVENAGHFSPMFTLGVSYMLASLVAGPLIKGKEGRELGKGLLQTALSFLNVDAADDQNQSQQRDLHSDYATRAPWLSARDYNPGYQDAVIVRDED